MRTAIGFAPHSGWAAFVIVSGNAANPQVLLRGRVEMADPRLAGSKQPYHAVEGLPLREAETRLALLSKSARRMAYDAIRPSMEDIRKRGYSPSTAGILASSGRSGSTLAAVLASHALIHTADGDHFREALAEACGRCGLTVIRIRQKELVSQAASALRRSPEEIQASVRDLGRPLGPPWTADQKSAALLAWLLLADESGERKDHG